jgi:hypothetical protein
VSKVRMPRQRLGYCWGSHQPISSMFRASQYPYHVLSYLPSKRPRQTWCATRVFAQSAGVGFRYKLPRYPLAHQSESTNPKAQVWRQIDSHQEGWPRVASLMIKISTPAPPSPMEVATTPHGLSTKHLSVSYPTISTCVMLRGDF